MLTEIQSRAAQIMAANRSETSYFADGAALNEHTERLSDDFCPGDIHALEKDGLDVFVDLDVRGCVEARVRDESRRETVIRWMSETRSVSFRWSLIRSGVSGCTGPIWRRTRSLRPPSVASLATLSIWH